MIEEAAPKRHERILVLKADDGLLVWEGLRRVPEGFCVACVSGEEAREALLRLAASADLDETELPRIAVCDAASSGAPTPEEALKLFDCAVFDCVLVREPVSGLLIRSAAASRKPPPGVSDQGGDSRPETHKLKRSALEPSAASVEAFAASAARLLAPGGRLVFLASPPVMGERLSRILQADAGALEVDAGNLRLISRFKAAEDAFFSAPAGGTEYLFWDAETLKTGFQRAGLELKINVIDQEEERLITERDISAWFNSEKSRWGGAIHAALGEKDFETLKALLGARAKQGPVLWKWKSLLCRAANAGRSSP